MRRRSDGTIGEHQARLSLGRRAAPTPDLANLDGGHLGCVDVAAHPEGDSAWGCRQMLGNVWEWTVEPVPAFPGFAPDAYKEYSEPAFGTRKVLRGGAWMTRSRHGRQRLSQLLRPGAPRRFAGFRTVAL